MNLEPGGTSEGSPVMLVDDDPAIREAMAAIIELEGYTVVTAADGEEALFKLRTGARPFLILLDLRMPGMDGRTFREIQQGDASIDDIPVVVLSGDRDGNEIANALGTPCIAKPIDIDRLLSVVGRFGSA